MNIKAITFYQPWASLICDGRKTIETRSWSTKHRGEIAIHAGNTVDKAACEKFGYDPGSIPRGAIVCTVRIVNVVQFPDARAPPDEYGDFTPGRYGWLLVDVKPVTPPVPIKGQMGMWNWNVEDKKQTRLM